jgi:hypothetical protein
MFLTCSSGKIVALLATSEALTASVCVFFRPMSVICDAQAMRNVSEV